MKKIISILAVLISIYSASGSSLLLFQTKETYKYNSENRGPTLANHSTLSSVSLQLKSTTRNMPASYSNEVRQNEVRVGGKNSLFWAGLEKIDNLGKINYERVWKNDCQPGEIIVKGIDKVFKIPFTLEKIDAGSGGPDTPSASIPEYYYDYKIRILPSDWSVKEQSVQNPYDGNKQLLLTKKDGNITYNVTIIQGPCTTHQNYPEQHKGRTGVIILTTNNSI